MTDLEIVLGLVMLVGLVGVVLPVLPGLLLVAAAGLVWAVEGGGAGRWAVAGAVAAFAGLGTVASWVLPARRAATAGAPGWVLVAGAAGVVVGFFAIPVVGALVGWPAGIFAGELLRLRSAGPAWRTTVATVRAQGLAIAIQLAAGVAAVAVWAVAVVAT